MMAAFGRAYRVASAIRAPDLGWAVGLADALRSLGLRLLPRAAAAMWVGRERRAAFLGVVLLGAALAAAVGFPVALIAVGPLLYGVPHILADVRYLLVRPGLSKRPAFLGALAFGCALAAAGLGVRGAVVGCALAIGASRAPLLTRLGAVLTAAAVFALCQWVGPYYADLAFVHLHNFIGVAIWFFWRDRARRLHFLFGAAFLIGAAAIALGAADPVLAVTSGLSAPWTGLTLAEIAAQVSPVSSGGWAERLTVLYAFGQAAHYIVWLRLMPEDDRPSPAPRNYRRTYRALAADLGGPVLWIALVSAVVFLVWACFTVGGARDAYMKAAFFHAHLELVAIGVLLTERRFPYHATTVIS